MKKVLPNSKLSAPSKFVRRVLSRTSNISHEETSKNKPETSNTSPVKIGDPKVLETELGNLREQISVLQTTLNNMQEDVEKREKAVANLANEKQQLATELRREKRSTTNLKQQLSEERDFYYKEKEQYCKEMNKCKKIKKKQLQNSQSNKDVCKQESEAVIWHKDQVAKLREALQQTLEANYNLSLKFLRMKSTKSDLKLRLKNQERDYEQRMHVLEGEMDSLKHEISDVVDKRFMLPISPSNKKYLQVIKHNGKLIHENLFLQMEVHRLNTELERFKASKRHDKSQKRNKIMQKAIESKNDKLDSKFGAESKKLKTSNKLKSSKRISEKSSGKMKQGIKADAECKSKQDLSDMKVIKIYERKKTVSIPEVVMLHSNSKKEECNAKTEAAETQIIKTSTVNMEEVSENLSEICLESVSSCEAIRTRSAPEIVPTSLFVSEH